MSAKRRRRQVRNAVRRHGLWVTFLGLPPASAIVTGIVLGPLGPSLVPTIVAIGIGSLAGLAATVPILWWTAESLRRDLFDNGFAWVGPGLVAAGATLGVATVIR